MRKRFFSILVVFALMLTLPAEASSVMTTAEKETLYQKTIEELQTYLESLNEDQATLEGLLSSFQTLGGFQKNRAMYFSYYTGVLMKVAAGTFDWEYTTWMEMLKSNKDFQEYLTQIGDIGTVEGLSTYAEGRRCEAEGLKREAAAQYAQCLDFFDASTRYSRLMAEQSQALYDAAKDQLNSGDLAGAYFSFAEISGYRDSSLIMESIVRQLGYTPESAADNPQPVTGLKITRTTAESVTLSWKADPHPVTYRVEYGEKNGKTAEVTTTFASTTISGLKPETSYVFYVTIVSGNTSTQAVSITGKTAEMVTPVPAPNAVKNIRAASKTKTSVTLSWEHDGDADSYSVYSRLNGTENWVLADTTRAKICTVYGLKAETAYDFRIVATASGFASNGTLLKNVKTDKTTLKEGDHITFGHYPQTENGTDIDPIEWIVLEVQENKALILSRYGLDGQPYHKSLAKVTWEKCTLRTWLNKDFQNTAFSQSEKKAILPTNVSNKKDQGYEGWETPGGNNTRDKIFLLSYAEASKYFDVQHYSVMGSDNGKNMKSRVTLTAYALRQGAQTDPDHQTEDGVDTGSWWLRSPGGIREYAAIVGNDGSLYTGGVNFDFVCVRPALWLNIGP